MFLHRSICRCLDVRAMIEEKQSRFKARAF
jgi:hypothetical protein